jgi:hypothetical protein
MIDVPSHNKRFGNMAAEGITIGSGNSNHLQFGQKYFNLAFCCYLYLQYFNRQRLRADEFQIRHIAKPYSLCES